MQEIILVLALTVGFDYPDAEMPGVARFERRIDDCAWESLGIPASAVFPETRPESRTYIAPLPPITPGQHVVMFRACSVDVCSEASTRTITVRVE
jgi:hypothetical protein